MTREQVSHRPAAAKVAPWDSRGPRRDDLSWLAHEDHPALDEACDRCLGYAEVDLPIRGRAIGLLARVLYPDLPADPASEQAQA